MALFQKQPFEEKSYSLVVFLKKNPVNLQLTGCINVCLSLENNIMQRAATDVRTRYILFI